MQDPPEGEDGERQRAEPTCSSEARLENMGMISLLTLSSSSTLANSPSLEAAARRTIGVSSEHRFRKYLGVRDGVQEETLGSQGSRQRGTSTDSAVTWVLVSPGCPWESDDPSLSLPYPI